MDHRHRPTPAFPFARFRRIRFGDAVPPCPGGCSSRVHRWGTFSGRRRYRCTTCGRTFSDFTGTALARLKRVDVWTVFCQCMLGSMTVRRSAELLGVDKNTTFRWRHLLLEAMDRSETLQLGGMVVVHETSFPYSEKGRRGLDRDPRHRSTTDPFGVPRVWVLVAADKDDRVVSCVAGLRRPVAADLEAAMATRLSPGAGVASVVGPYGAVGLFAVRTDRPYRRIPSATADFQRIHGYVLALRRWLRRFHGVATRYLSNYLAWHRLLSSARDTWSLAARFSLGLSCPPCSLSEGPG